MPFVLSSLIRECGPDSVISCAHTLTLFPMLSSDSQESASLSVMHSSASVKVSSEEAQRLDTESISHLLSQRKLALVVDLDQTVIHATVDPTVGEWMKDPDNPNFEALKSVGRFRLGIDGEEIKDDDDVDAPKDMASMIRAAKACWYYVKPRPGVPNALSELSKRYELHVYTMGTRSYATCVCKLIDPDASIFGSRILSRDENGSLTRKSLNRLFPVDHSMVVIIDDRDDVWQRSPNLVSVPPYEFFVGIGDINATFLPKLSTDSSALPDSSDAAALLGIDGPATTTVEASPSKMGPSDDVTSNVAPALGSEEVVDTRTDEEIAASKKAAALLALQTETLQDKIAEQRDARPLARMQEALNEKLGKQGASASPSGASTPNGDASEIEVRHEQTGLDAAPSSLTAESETSRSADDSIPKPILPLPPIPPPPQESHAVLVDDDQEMSRIQSILESIHEQWYKRYDEMQARPKPQEASDPTIQKPDVIEYIAAKKAQVLQGCVIVFSSMIPIGHASETSDLWAVAKEFGAVPSDKVEPGVTTHIVAALANTAKVLQAQKAGGIEVVWSSWFHVSTSRWQRQSESLYKIPVLPNLQAFNVPDVTNGSVLPANDVGDAAALNGTQTSADDQGTENPAAFEDELNEMDWGAAADEVDAYLDSATTASNTSSPSPSMLAMDNDFDDDQDTRGDTALLNGGLVDRKRSRPSDSSVDGRNDDSVNVKDYAGEASKKRRQDMPTPPSASAEQGAHDTTETNSVDESFLDDLAAELDGELDDE